MVNVLLAIITRVVSGSSLDKVESISAPSTLDTNDVMISCYSETYSQASDLAQKIRVAMDRINEGTYGGEQIQSSQFQSYNDIFDDTSGDAGIYRKALDFEIRQINPTS